MAATVEYPPAEFCRKYGRLLAPNGALLRPQRAFAAYKGADGQVREKTQKAFKVTLKRLRRSARVCVVCGKPAETTLGEVTGTCRPCHVFCCDTSCAAEVSTHQVLCVSLEHQFLDQVIECLPAPLNLFTHLDFSKSGCPPSGLSWNSWFARQPRLTAALQSAAAVAHEWCSLAGMSPAPSVEEVRLCLQRITTGLVSLPLTLVRALHVAGLKHKTVDIHMVGADLPEVSMAYNGLCRLACGTGVRCARITLVSPDENVRAMAKSAPPSRPLEAGPCQVSAWDGLYHVFHEALVETGKLNPPHLVVCIHPGLHTDEGFASWRPTLELLVQKGYPVALTTYNEQEWTATLQRLAAVQANVGESGENPVRSQHVKQTPKDRRLVWSANAYFISFQGERAA
ncbi:putative protein MSS51 homolog, mitochondrial isoform X2 [Amphibalanus amphitrite]|nr:putative protein MSS51 homolog, mitochondrial isoform X2 [Amphibalanus amphitrite]